MGVMRMVKAESESEKDEGELDFRPPNMIESEIIDTLFYFFPF